MRTYYTSGSKLGLARLCPGSTALPHGASLNPAAAMGSAIHEHLADRVQIGVPAAFARLNEVAAAWELDEDETRILAARCRAFTFGIPEHALVEVALALRADGAVVRAVGGRGEYEVPAGTILPITVDAIWAEPYPLLIDQDTGAIDCPEGSVLWVIDWKSGSDKHPDPIEHNRQAHAGALVAARFTGAASVVPAIVYVRSGQGEWDTLTDAAGQTRAMTAEELARVEQEIQETHRQCAEQERRYAAGEPLRLVEGQHCGWCAARDSCPAKLAMIRAVVTGELVVPGGAAAPLTAEHAAKLAVMLPQLDRWSEKGKRALKEYVASNGPIDLGGGRVYGPHDVIQDEIDPTIGLVILTDEIGAEYASQAITPAKLSKTRMEDAIKAALEEQGVKRQGEATKRRVYGKLKAAGALAKITVTKVEAHKVREEIEATADLRVGTGAPLALPPADPKP